MPLSGLYSKLLCTFFLALASATLFAVEGTDLFRVAIPVESQSAAERARAAGLGLRKVLIRMSGSPAAVESDVVRQAYSEAQNYIVQFRYEAYMPPPGVETTATEQLVMTFSKQIIERLLREAEQPYWPPNRPPVLVWLVEDQAGKGRVLINDSANPVVDGLTEAARERGLMLQWPLLDLEDQLALSANDLWRLNEAAIAEASERYEVDTLLVGRFSRTSRGEWLSTWQFHHRGESRQYDFRAESPVQLGRQAVDPLADYLASLYAVSAGREGTPELLIQVSQVQDFADYRKALDYLLGLALISDVSLQAVRGDSLLLSLRTDGSLQMLRNTFGLEKKLQPETVPDVETPPWLRPQEGTPENPAEFNWRGQ